MLMFHTFRERRQVEPTRVAALEGTGAQRGGSSGLGQSQPGGRTHTLGELVWGVRGSQDTQLTYSTEAKPCTAPKEDMLGKELLCDKSGHVPPHAGLSGLAPALAESHAVLVLCAGPWWAQLDRAAHSRPWGSMWTPHSRGRGWTACIFSSYASSSEAGRGPGCLLRPEVSRGPPALLTFARAQSSSRPLSAAGGGWPQGSPCLTRGPVSSGRAPPGMCGQWGPAQGGPGRVWPGCFLCWWGVPSA